MYFDRLSAGIATTANLKRLHLTKLTVFQPTKSWYTVLRGLQSAYAITTHLHSLLYLGCTFFYVISNVFEGEKMSSPKGSLALKTPSSTANLLSAGSSGNMLPSIAPPPRTR